MNDLLNLLVKYVLISKYKKSFIPHTKLHFRIMYEESFYKPLILSSYTLCCIFKEVLPFNVSKSICDLFWCLSYALNDFYKTHFVIRYFGVKYCILCTYPSFHDKYSLWGINVGTVRWNGLKILQQLWFA